MFEGEYDLRTKLLIIECLNCGYEEEGTVQEQQRKVVKRDDYWPTGKVRGVA